jgi:hypothetical protein
MKLDEALFKAATNIIDGLAEMLIQQQQQNEAYDLKKRSEDLRTGSIEVEFKVIK